MPFFFFLFHFISILKLWCGMHPCCQYILLIKCDEVYRCKMNWIIHEENVWGDINFAWSLWLVVRSIHALLCHFSLSMTSLHLWLSSAFNQYDKKPTSLIYDYQFLFRNLYGRKWMVRLTS